MTLKIDNYKDCTEQSKNFPDDRVKSNYILQQEWLEKSPTPIFYKDRDGRYLGCNLAFEEFMSIERNSIIGKKVHEVWPEKYASIYKDKDIQLMENEGNQTYEFQIQTSKGEIKDVIFYKSTFKNSDGIVGGLIGSILDITDRKLAEKALIEKKELYHTLFENTRDIKLLIDPYNFNIIDANSAAAGFYGYSLKELRSMKIFQINILTHQQIKEEMANALNKNKDYFNFQHRLADGSIRDVEAYSSPIEINGQILLHSTIHDITLRKTESAECEIRNLQLKKTESLGRMAGAIAHSYNNILAVIMGNLELAIDYIQNKTADPTEELHDAINAARRAASMGGQILSYLGQKQTIFGQKIVDISEMCQQWLPEFKGIIPNNITFKTTFPPSEIPVNVNAEQLKQVLHSIINNATESIGDNVGVISLNIKSVSIEDIEATHRFPVEWNSESEFYACLEVQDDGCGIAPNEIEKIFDPFYSTKFIGRGLGLSVVFGTVKAYGGCITVKSSHVNKGSIFKLFFPLSKKSAQIHKTVKNRSELDKNLIFNGLTVLLVEDEPMVRKMSIHMLKRFGINVIEANDGVEAVDIFGQHKDEIYCVISDLSMPKMDGWQTIDALRKIKRDVKVILASGYDQSHVMKESHSELPQAFLTKPYSIKTLESVLTSFMEL